MSRLVLASEITLAHFLQGLGEAFPTEILEDSGDLRTYWDTFDWRLLRSGLTLTSSEAGKRRWISLEDSDGCVSYPETSRVPRFAAELPQGPLQESVHPVSGHRRLLPRGQARWKSTLVAVLNEDGKTVVRLLFREGEALLPNDRGTIPLLPRIQRIPLKGYGKEKRKVTFFLRKNLGATAESQSDLEAVCEAHGHTPRDYSSSFNLILSPRLSAGKAARRIHRDLLERIVANQEGVLNDWDTEFLHDFRVAVRRTRSALSQLKGIYPEAETRHFSEEFRWLGGRTGPSRDIDVYLLKIPAYRSILRPEAREDLEPLVKVLREKKRIEHRRLRGCLRSRRFQRLLEDWRVFLDTPVPSNTELPEARLPARTVASRCIWSTFNEVVERGGEINRASNAETLHRLRIQCKKLRYLISFFRSLYRVESVRSITKDLKGLQDHLGAFNDLQVQREALRRLAEEMMAAEIGPPATLLAMGQLMGQLGEKQIQERDAFHRHFNQFSRPKTQKRFRKLFGPGSGTDKGYPKEKDGS